MSDSEACETIHLKARGMSGRGVRYKILAPDFVSHCETQCARMMTKETTLYQLNESVRMMALESMILEVTEPGVSPEKLMAAPWRKVTPDELHAGWAKFFNAKDTQLLKRVYDMEHTVSKDEIDEIMAGKVSPVP